MNNAPLFNPRSISNGDQPVVQWLFEMVKHKDACLFDGLVYNCLVQYMPCDARKPAVILHYAGFLKPLQRWQRFNGTYPVPIAEMRDIEKIMIHASLEAHIRMPHLKKKIGRDPERVKVQLQEWYRSYYAVHPLL